MGSDFSDEVMGISSKFAWYVIYNTNYGTYAADYKTDRIKRFIRPSEAMKYIKDHKLNGEVYKIRRMIFASQTIKEEIK